jgi:hypothetical protein
MRSSYSGGAVSDDRGRTIGAEGGVSIEADALKQSAEVRRFVDRLERAVQARVYRRTGSTATRACGYFDITQEALITALLIGYEAGRREVHGAPTQARIPGEMRLIAPAKVRGRKRA